MQWIQEIHKNKIPIPKPFDIFKTYTSIAFLMYKPLSYIYIQSDPVLISTCDGFCVHPSSLIKYIIFHFNIVNTNINIWLTLKVLVIFQKIKK